MNKSIFFIIGLSILPLTGCMSVFQPRIDTFQMDYFPEFNATGKISVINNQNDTKNFLHVKGLPSFGGNRKAWTDSAVKMIRRELSKRQATFSDSEKKLEVAVLCIKGDSSFSAIRYIVTIEVKTGNNYRAIYTGDNSSPATVWRAADGALMRAVTAIFRDPRIIAYLTN